MKRHTRIAADALFVLGAAMLFLGCLASSYRSAQTLQPGQASLGAGYLNAIDLDEPESESVDLLNLDARVGAARGFDLGFMHTWDLTPDNDGSFSTIWGDAKIQITNLANTPGKPVFALGLMKGYVYPDAAQTHVTTLPLTLSIPVNEFVTPTVMYRYELFSEGFLPDADSFESPRHFFAAGCEIALSEPAPHKWTPKLGISIGTFNALTGDPDGNNGLTINFGISVDTPYR